MRTTLSRLVLIVCPCFLFLLPCRAGVPAEPSMKVQIRWLQSPRTLPTSLQHQATNHLVQWLQSRGITVVDKARQIIWCDVYMFGGADSENVVLSVGLGQTLPPEVIEAGKKGEVLYAGMSARKKASLPREGKWVRESLSEDFLYEYMRPDDHELAIVSKSLLLARLDDLMELLYRRHFKP